MLLGGEIYAALDEKLAAAVTDAERAGRGGEWHCVIRALVTEYPATIPTVVLKEITVTVEKCYPLYLGDDEICNNEFSYKITKFE